MNRTSLTVGSTNIDSAKLRKNLSSGSPQIQALVRSMVPDKYDSSRNTEDREARVKYSKLKSLSDIIANNINANTDLRQITPYISKAELIWKTLLLYPNGAQEQILTYDTLDSSIKNTTLHNELNTRLRKYFTTDYKIEDELPKIVSEMTCGSGSYIKLTLSRPALDHIINGQQRYGDQSDIQGTENYNNALRASVEKEFVRTDISSDPKTPNYVWLAKNKGLVKDPNAPSGTVHGLESLFSTNASFAGMEYFPLGKEFGITVTDNVSSLSLSEISRNRTNQIIDDVIGTESLASIIRTRRAEQKKAGEPTQTKLTGNKSGTTAKPSGVNTTLMTDGQLEAIQNQLYGNRDYVRKPVTSVRLSDSYSMKPFGVPLSFIVPSEAFIPVHLDGDPTKQVGGYILLDPSTGEFLKSTKDYTFNQSIKKQDSKIDTPNQQGSTNQLISSLRRVQEGGECDFDMSEFSLLSKDQIEKSLIQAIASGTSGRKVTLSLEQETLKIYLSRAFRQQGVRTLYVPAESYTYFALNYNRMGIGQSLTNRAKMYIARLAALDVADALANLDQAQTRNELTIGLQQGDPDPEHTIEVSRAKWFLANPTLHSIISAGSLSVPDIVEAMRQQSLVVRVDANDNPYMPAPTINVQQIERTGFKSIDDNARQNLLSSIASTFMLQRSWLDDKEDGNNFQVEALAEQEMLRNQTVLWSNDLSLLISDFVRKNVALNGVLLNSLIEIIENHKELHKPDSGEKIPDLEGDELVEVILADYLNSIRITLPQPASMETTTKLKDKINAVNELVTGWIDMSGGQVMMERMLQQMGVETENLSKDAIAATLKGVYLIDLYKRMNLPMPFDSVAAKGKEGGMFSLLENIGMYEDNIGLFLVNYAKASTKRNERIKKDLDKIIGPETPEETIPSADGEQTDNDFNLNDTPADNIPGDDTAAGDDGQSDDNNDQSTDDQQTNDDQNTDENKGDDNEPDFNVSLNIPE